MTLDQVKNLLKAAGPDIKFRSEPGIDNSWYLKVVKMERPFDDGISEEQIKGLVIGMCADGYRNSKIFCDAYDERYLKVAHRLLTSWLRGPK